MHHVPFLPHSALRAIVIVVSGLVLAFGALAGTEGSASAEVRGFVVRLKEAPTHLQRARALQAGAREQPQAVAAADRESARWQRVLGGAGLDGRSGRRAPALRPVGRDQHWLQFDAPLSATEVEAMRARLAARPEVDWVEPVTRERRLQVPDDPYFASGQQWWLGPVSGTDGNVLADRRRGLPGFQSAWARPGGTGAPSAVVAILDTGITAHPDLAGRVLPGYDFVSDSKFAADGDGRDADASDPGDGVTVADLTDAHFKGCATSSSSWHGTVTSGIVAAATRNGLGVAGIQWNGRVLPVRVAGKCGADVADIVEGMRWAAGLSACRRDDGNGTCLEFAPTNPNPARVINISFGGSSACGAVYQTTIDELKAAGVVVVAAGGNEHGSATRPANCARVVGVVGLARDGYKTSYSNFGAEFTATGIATVAGDDGTDSAARWNALADEGILSLGNQGASTPLAADFAAGYFYFWGTSFASPIAAGAVGLMLSVNPALTWDQIVDGLRRSARPHVTSQASVPARPPTPGAASAPRRAAAPASSTPSRRCCSRPIRRPTSRRRARPRSSTRPTSCSWPRSSRRTVPVSSRAGHEQRRRVDVGGVAGGARRGRGTVEALSARRSPRGWPQGQRHWPLTLRCWPAG